MKIIDTDEVRTSLFTEDLAVLALRLYAEEEGNYTAVQRRLQAEGHLDITYRQVYRFFENQGLHAQGLAVPKVTIEDYADEIVDAYYCVHGNTRRACHLLAENGINYSESPIQLLWESKGLRPLGQKVSAEIKKMMLDELIPLCGHSYATIAKVMPIFGITPSSYWENLFRKQAIFYRYSASSVLEEVLKRKKFTNNDFEELADYFEKCEGNPHKVQNEFSLPISVILFHWDDAEKPFDFKYVPAISYKMTPKVKQRFSPDELTTLVGGVLAEAGLDATAAWNKLKKEGKFISINQVLKVAKKLRRKKFGKIRVHHQEK